MGLARPAVQLLLVAFLLLGIPCGARADKVVWLLGNDFHTSLVLRARDVSFQNEITNVRDADEIAFGWGASADYRGPSTPWTVLQAIFPNRAALHIVPIRGSVTQSYPHSDVVLLRLSDSSFTKLLGELDRSFAFTSDHHRIYLGRGQYADGRFYASSEVFYFPYVCNMWVALKLTHAGVPFFQPRAILSNSLILQAGEKGVTLQRHRAPAEDY